jgi:PqqD family protein of HPr-rel-A system
MGVTADIWIGPVVDRLSSVPLDPLTACFDRQSGQTHFLADPLPQILNVLTAKRLSTDACVEALMAEFQMAETVAEVMARVEECLRELAQLGLVERA